MDNAFGFDFRRVHDAQALEDIYRLRYKVYVEEWGFERSEDHPGGIERDAFDEHSMHFVAARYGQMIGTIRLIRHSEKGFPIEHHCTIDCSADSLEKCRIAEISRLAVSKEYRKRLEDRRIFRPDLDGGDVLFTEETLNSRRKRQEIIVGLFKAMYAESKKAGLTHWYAVMAKALYVLLQRLGIVFTPIGPEVNYHGLRAPYILEIKEGERALAERNPELLREFEEAALK